MFDILIEPDTIDAKLQELSRNVRCRGELIADYMHRVKMLVIRAHRDVLRLEQERIFVLNITRSLFDKKLAIYLATVNPTSSLEAERIATICYAMIAEQKARKRYNLYCSISVDDEEKFDVEDYICAAGMEQRPKFNRSISGAVYSADCSGQQQSGSLSRGRYRN